MVQRTLSGAFTVRAPSGDVWRIDGMDPLAPRLYVRGLRGGDGAVLAESRVRGAEGGTVMIEWTTAGRVKLTLHTTAATAVLIGDSAYLHEPQRRLYDDLPLARFDGTARRFWRRAFAIVRIPGGGLLLRLLARSRLGRR